MDYLEFKYIPALKAELSETLEILVFSFNLFFSGKSIVTNSEYHNNGFNRIWLMLCISNIHRKRDLVAANHLQRSLKKYYNLGRDVEYIFSLFLS